MILKYKDKIICTENFENLKAKLSVDYNLKGIPTFWNYDLTIWAEKGKIYGTDSSLVIEIKEIEDIKEINKLMEDIAKNILEKNEYYNIETKIKELENARNKEIVQPNITKIL